MSVTHSSNEEIIGRDEINDIEAILSVTNTDVDEVQHIGSRTWRAVADSYPSAVIVGLTGALVIIRPGFVTVDPGALAMLVAAPLFAVSDIVAKLLTRRESGPAVVAYLSVFVTLVTLGPALYVWRTPTKEETLLLALTGALATIGHLLMTQGIKVAEMRAIQPGKFLQLVWAALVGYLVFREVPEVWTWIGAALIIGSATYITHREAQIRRRALEAQDAQSNSTNSG